MEQMIPAGKVPKASSPSLGFVHFGAIHTVKHPFRSRDSSNMKPTFKEFFRASLGMPAISLQSGAKRRNCRSVPPQGSTPQRVVANGRFNVKCVPLAGC